MIDWNHRTPSTKLIKFIESCLTFCVCVFFHNAASAHSPNSPLTYALYTRINYSHVHYMLFHCWKLKISWVFVWLKIKKKIKDSKAETNLKTKTEKRHANAGYIIHNHVINVTSIFRFPNNHPKVMTNIFPRRRFLSLTPLKFGAYVSMHSTKSIKIGFNKFRHCPYLYPINWLLSRFQQLPQRNCSILCIYYSTYGYILLTSEQGWVNHLSMQLHKTGRSK